MAIWQLKVTESRSFGKRSGPGLTLGFAFVLYDTHMEQVSFKARWLEIQAVTQEGRVLRAPKALNLALCEVS